ncbi:MAG: hypothetical protein COX19_15470 [Desulfobacterales bacterium CG23_combo_of_CG06-09_8_20_14_all_51_8]|nr:MAG: hypothetical protein COX19_15470 [Desulfobacterales bacterium CG23_combo_of_CG06-09_8_20_14_all_51_8]
MHFSKKCNAHAKRFFVFTGSSTGQTPEIQVHAKFNFISCLSMIPHSPIRFAVFDEITKTGFFRNPNFSIPSERNRKFRS